MPENNLYTKFAKVKANLKIKKDAKNDFAGFKYATLDSILEAVNQELSTQELVFNILDYTDDGQNNYKVKAVLTDGNQSIEFNYLVHGAVITTKAKGESFEAFVYKIQDGGSAITYVTRYVYGLVFSIPFEDDFIQKNTGNPDTQPAKKTPAKPWFNLPQFNEFKEKIKTQNAKQIQDYVNDINNQFNINNNIKEQIKQAVTQRTVELQQPKSNLPEVDLDEIINEM